MTDETKPKKRGRLTTGDAMVSVHLRIPTDIFDYYKNFSAYSVAMREALREYMKEHA
jgi:uncharacterized protein (DUF4415 family)